MRPLLALLFLVLASPAGLAQSGPEQDDGSWQWRIAPYFWASGIDGTVTTPAGSMDLDIEFDDIWDNLEAGALLQFQATRGQLSIVTDAIYLGIDADGETPGGMDADLEMDTVIVQLAGLYRVTPTSPFEVGGGVRYAYMDPEPEIGAISGGESADTIDGFFATRATWPFGERFCVTLYGDVGAGNSDLTWQASGIVGMKFSSWGLGVGYRALDYDFEDGATEVDLTLQGLILGAEFRF